MSRPVLSESAAIPAGVLDELIARLETATGPDRVLDRLIEETLPGVLRHPHPDNVADNYVLSGPGHPDFPTHRQGYQPPEYTGSLDAAMGLVARMLPEWGGMIDFGPSANSVATVWSPIWEWGEDEHGDPDPVQDIEIGDSVSPAIALCLATFRAIAAIQKAQPSPPPSSVNEASTESAGLDNQ